MRRMEVIQSVLDAGGRGTYLEIGVFEGRCFFRIKADRKIAVDPQFKRLSLTKLLSLPSARKKYYFKLGSDEFFSSRPDALSSGIDVAFIDGLHSYEQSLRDVTNCLKYLNPNGTIIMHDCSPTTESMAHPAQSYGHAQSLKLPAWTGEWCGDVWKTIAHLRSMRGDLEVFVLDCDYGVGIIRRGPPDNMLPFSAKEIGNMSYDYLRKNRAMLLNLKPEHYILEHPRPKLLEAIVA